MGIQFRRFGTTILASAVALAVAAPAAFAQAAPEDTPAASPSPFRVTASFADAASADQQTASKSSHHEGFGFGIKGGFLFNSLSSSPINGAAINSGTGSTVGIFFGGNRPGRFGVMGELMYNNRKGSSGGSNLSVHSLEIPVLFRLNIGSQSLKGALVYAIFGPAIDIQLTSKLNGADVSSNFNGYNVNFIAGAGIEITRFIVEVRGDWGFTSVNKNLNNVATIHTKAVAFLVGFRIN